MDELQKILPVTRVKRELLEILKSMKEEYSTITMTRNGEPVCVREHYQFVNKKLDQADN
jgi:hypothetical protein